MRLQICEVVNDLEHLNEETIIEAIENHRVIMEWAYILHDKDIKEDGTVVNPHWHIELRLSEARDTKAISKWFGIGENYVNSSKSKSCKHLKFNDMLAYTIHSCKPEKHQYDISEVKTNIGDLELRIDDYKKRMNGHPITFKKNEELELIINQIVQGEIREFNLVDRVPGQLYSKHAKEIKNAFDYRRKMLMVQGKKEMDVYYFYGNSGTGKTTFAKEIAERKGLSYFISSSKNDVLDGYAGQDVIILDDLRPSSFELCDLLKLLDNNTNSSIKSRYHNKVLEAKIIIITSIHSIKIFFENTTKDVYGDEPIKQLKRRILLYAHFSEEDISAYVYNKMKDDYDHLGVFENTISKKYPKEPPTEETKTMLKELFPKEIKTESKKYIF